MSCALWVRKKLNPNCVVAAIILAPIAVLAGNMRSIPIDSLYLGILVSAICCGAGAVFETKE